MLHYQEQDGETHPAAEQEEGRHELGQGQRLARGLLSLPWLTRASEPESLKTLQVAVFSITHQFLVELRQPLGLFGKGHPVSRHGVPAAHGEEPALVILAHQVVQHGAVIDEGLEVPASGGECCQKFRELIHSGFWF